jgi:hypothetical protein
MKATVLIYLAAVILSLCLYGCKQKNHIHPEDSFLGDWYTIKGDVEAYSFLKDSSSYIFVGTQGGHPVVYGSWKIDKDKFIITMDNGKTTQYSFKILNDTLSFSDGKEIYTRTIPLEVKYPEVRILMSLAGDFSSMKFSAPRSADLNWGTRIDNVQSSRSFTLKGYSISGVTTISSGVISGISNYLQESGFEPDTIYATEHCNGFHDNNQIVTICTRHDPKATNDLVYIEITSGLILK